MRKSFLNPKSEDRAAWTLGFTASAINLFAIEEWKFTIAVYPIYMVAGNGLIAALLYRPRLNRRRLRFTKTKKQTGRNQFPSRAGRVGRF